MQLQQFRQLIRAYVPSAKTSVIDDTLLDLIINEGVKDVNIFALAYKGNQKFTVTAEQQEYLMSDVITDFLMFDESGLWWNDGSSSSPNWKRLGSYTRRALDDDWPRWRDDDSDNPLRYIIENNILTIHPKPNTTLSSGFWAFYIKKPTSMTAATHYPFSGSTVEITSLAILDDAIVDYVRWKLARPLGKDQQGVITEQDYRKNLAIKIQALNRRLDISAYPGLRMKGPSV